MWRLSNTYHRQGKEWVEMEVQGQLTRQLMIHLCWPRNTCCVRIRVRAPCLGGSGSTREKGVTQVKNDTHKPRSVKLAHPEGK